MAITREARVLSRHSGLGERAGYLPTLDGWRAVAILAVICTHDSLHSIGPLSTRWLYLHGGSGVDLFFAISGLLICSRLLEEERVFGFISLRNFYIRRAFRILPPALAYLGALAILILTGVLHIGWREWLGTAFFLRNYHALMGRVGPDSWFTGHFWSLAVEEHFYLILPAVLVLTRKRWRVSALSGLCLLVLVHRFSVLQTRPWGEVLFHTGTRLDGLLIPALLTVLVQKAEFREAMKKWLRFWPLLLIPVIAMCTYWEGSFARITFLALLMPLTVLGSVLNPKGYLALFLEWAPLRYIGRVSYSLYIWQQLFFPVHYDIGYPLGILENTPLRYVATLAIAIASYHFLERPLIKLGHKLAPPATPGRDDISGDTSKTGQPATTLAAHVEANPS